MKAKSCGMNTQLVVMILAGSQTEAAAMNKALQPVLQAGLQAQLLELLHLLTQLRAGGTGVAPSWEHQLLRSLASIVAASSSARSHLLTAKEPGQAGILVQPHRPLNTCHILQVNLDNA